MLPGESVSQAFKRYRGNSAWSYQVPGTVLGSLDNHLIDTAQLLKPLLFLQSEEICPRLDN